MDDSFIKNIKQDLVKSGFGAELKVRKIFKEHLKTEISSYWEIETASMFFDKDENKSREIDLIATAESNLMNVDSSYIVYHLFCEVKKSKSPWIVFKDSDVSNSYRVKSSSYDTRNTDIDDILRNTNTYLPKLMKWKGSGIHEAFKNPSQPSRWYSAFLATVKASIDNYERWADDEFEESIKSIALDIYQPVVIVDGILLSSELDDNDEIELQEIMFASFPFEYKTKNYQQEQHSVDLVSLEYFSEYLRYTEGRKWEIIERMYDKIEEYTNKKVAEEDRGTFMYCYPKDTEKL